MKLKYTDWRERYKTVYVYIWHDFLCRKFQRAKEKKTLLKWISNFSKICMMQGSYKKWVSGFSKYHQWTVGDFEIKGTRPFTLAPEKL